MGKRAGELSAAELESLMVIVSNPRQFRVPDWFLNRKKDVKDGKYTQLTSNQLDTKLRDDIERLKKMRNHRGLRHYWGIKVRGQTHEDDWEKREVGQINARCVFGQFTMSTQPICRVANVCVTFSHACLSVFDELLNFS